MPKPNKWDLEFVEAMLRLTATVIDYGELTDAESDALVAIVLPRLRQTSAS
jgi:hypothetical protein